MKKITIVAMSLMLMFALASCGAKAEPLSLDGKWKEVNANETYHEATIQGNTIVINWVDDVEKSESLYWAGSVDVPGEDVTTDSEYKWDSKNDTSKTEFALLASDDETKQFTYKNGVISYKASALGTTKTVELKKDK